MILDFNEGLKKLTEVESYEYKGTIYYFDGIIWTYGKKSGKETVEYIAIFYSDNGYIPFENIFGAFYVIIKKPTDEVILFTDNSNMRCFFLSENAIGTNYLETINATKNNALDLEGVTEFLSFGNLFFGKTLVKDIKLSESNKYYTFVNDTFNVVDKEIGDIDRNSVISDVNQFFKEMAYSLSDLNSTVSLTGGYDSRLVFAGLRSKIVLDTFISGNNEEDMDIVISKKIATTTGNKFELIRSKKPEINIDYLEKLFIYSQGIAPFLNDGFFRINDFIKNRSDKYNCYLSGDGGVMHKDWWWLQDFPFYNKKTININKFYMQRIKYSKLDIPWGELLASSARDLDKNMIDKLSTFKKSSNTQSYDSLYFHVNGKKTSINYTIHSDVLNSYAPLWELELVRYSYNLPRKKRFYYWSMRSIITKASIKIARIPTSYGTTASTELVFVLRDVFFQGIDYFKKATRMLGRKFFNQNFFVGNPVTWSTEKEIRELDLTKDAIDYSLKKKIISEDTNFNNISHIVLGRLVQIYMLDNYIDKEKKV